MTLRQSKVWLVDATSSARWWLASEGRWPYVPVPFDPIDVSKFVGECRNDRKAPHFRFNPFGSLWNRFTVRFFCLSSF